MRLIDADALHSTLADWQLMLSETYGSNDEFVRCLEDVLCTVDNTPTIAAPRWVRVEEGLPDKYTQCLVADADGKCAVGYYRYDCEAWDSPAFGWIEVEDRMYIDDIPMGIGKVVAWMPIEPPKEE